MTWPTDRPPAVAGSFYPGERATLATDVDRMLAEATANGPSAEPALRGLIVPHAGYVYSGPVAATGYAVLRLQAASARRVVLLGPDHFVGIPGMAVPTVERFTTPLGPVAIDESLRQIALDQPGVTADDTAHAREHSLEVQLPFLQRVLEPGWTLLPVVVGPTQPEDVAGLIGALTADPATLVVISTDLSHYHDQARAQRLDRRTAAAIQARDVSAIGGGDACGRYPLKGMLALAAVRDWEVTLLDLRTSADTAGDPYRVVGYGTFTVAEPK